MVDDIIELCTLAHLLWRCSISFFERIFEVTKYLWIYLCLLSFLSSFVLHAFVLLFGAYALGLAMFSWWVDPFYNYPVSLPVAGKFLCSEAYFIGY